MASYSKSEVAGCSHMATEGEPLLSLLSCSPFILLFLFLFLHFLSLEMDSWVSCMLGEFSVTHLHP